MALKKSWGGRFYGAGEIGSETLQGLCTNIGTFASATLEDIMRNEALPVLKDLIEADVYKAYKNTWKGRTKEFKKAWDVRRINRGFFDTIEVFIDDGKITYNWDFQKNRYGHLASHSISNIEDLANIINNGMDYKPPMNFPQMPPRPFWDDFLEWLEDNIGIKMQEEFSKYGVDMVIGGGNGITIEE